MAPTMVTLYHYFSPFPSLSPFNFSLQTFLIVPGPVLLCEEVGEKIKKTNTSAICIPTLNLRYISLHECYAKLLVTYMSYCELGSVPLPHILLTK